MSSRKLKVENESEIKTGVINDPLGKPTVPAGSDCRLILKFWDGLTLCVKIVITTCRASWINKERIEYEKIVQLNW